jgi:hypothetical protein
LTVPPLEALAVLIVSGPDVSGRNRPDGWNAGSSTVEQFQMLATEHPRLPGCRNATRRAISTSKPPASGMASILND